MFTSSQFVEYCKKVYEAAWVYWYGTCGYSCTTSLYNSKKKQYPSHYTEARAAGYKKDISAGKMCADCVGLIKSFFWKNGNISGQNKYGTNHCPDTSADGMIGLCTETGPINTMPDIPGLVVWKSGHIGVYIGNGYTVEMKGFDYDCQMNRVSVGPWKKWGKLPASMLDYNTYPVPTPVTGFACKVKAGSWYVRIAPNKNAAAVSTVHEEDILPYLNETDNGWDKVEYKGSVAWISAKAVTLVQTEGPKYIDISGSWHVRTAPSKSSQSLGIVKNQKLQYQGEEKDGWYLVIYQNQNAWVSKKAGKIVG